jgi:hypothetical protein
MKCQLPLRFYPALSSCEKVAFMVISEVIGTVQLPVPEQPPPDQPSNIEPQLGLAVSLTDVPDANEALQVEPQLMPDGELLTVPEAVPELLIVLIVKVYEEPELKVAVTL